MTQRQPTDDFLGFLRIRGDAALAALHELRGNFAKQIEILDAVIAQIESIDSHLKLKGEPKSNLVSLLRDLYPDKTKGLSDADVMKLVGGGGIRHE